LRDGAEIEVGQFFEQGKVGGFEGLTLAVQVPLGNFLLGQGQQEAVKGLVVARGVLGKATVVLDKGWQP